jgi:diaminohydroxyphosphoribosylaminopyrimidine deaminase/5-amino-6-(5-phosphoribosylamino)uracil reductase
MKRTAPKAPPRRGSSPPTRLPPAWMDLAFAEAEAVRGDTLPNPAVGAILVRNGKVVGRGGTRPAGQAHAEIVALGQAGPRRSAGATLYVTLEPCSHFGRTPPCARALIAAGVSKVVAACPDPNPRVSGKGFAMLRRAGIEVEVAAPGSPARARAEAFYAGFFFWVRHGRPRIVVKIAQSLDGRINARAGEETPLTGPEARRFAHALRARADAILIGGKTLRVDDPDLTPRLTGGAPAQILVLTRQRKLDLKRQIFSRKRSSKTIVLSPKIPQNLPKWVDFDALAALGDQALAKKLMAVFASRSYHEVLIEGGRGVWAPFLNAGLCDVLHLVTAPRLLPDGESWGKDLRPAWVKPLEFHRFTPLGPDILAEFRRRPADS